MQKQLPTFFLTHGGGPWPWATGDMRSMHARAELALRELPCQVGAKPAAILVVSGHWEERDFAVMAAAQPGMIYDFGGFPEEFYQVRYPAPGAPDLARRTHALIAAAGLESHLDPQRGFDHGTYVPLAVAYPAADVPVIEVSIRADYNPEAHLRLGAALAPLRDEGVLIIGSGSSYHDLRAFFRTTPGQDPGRDSRLFDVWLQETLTRVPPGDRYERLRRWDQAPAARAAHPREDHLLPLHAAVGAAMADAGAVVYQEAEFFGRLAVSSYRFGGAAPA